MITSLFQTAAESQTHDNTLVSIDFFYLKDSKVDNYNKSNISHLFRTQIREILSQSCRCCCDLFFTFLILITLDQMV